MAAPLGADQFFIMGRLTHFAMAAACAASFGCSRGGEAPTAPPRATSKALTVVCRKDDAWPQSRDATFAFADGALIAEGGFGDMKLSASRTDQKADNGSGANVIGIRASGPASAPMPDKAALEKCLADAGGDPSDRDVVAYHVNLCQQQVADGAQPVPIDVEVTITVIDAPSADVFIRRTFKQESAAAGGPITLETLPPLTCEVS